MTKQMTQKKQMQDLAALYSKAAESIGQGGSSFLKFTKADSWTLGMDRDPITEKDLFAVNAASIRHGWIGWENGQKVYDELFSVAEPLPLEETLTPISGGDMNGYSEQWALKGTFLADKTEAIYQTWSRGGVSFFSDLLRDIAHGIQRNPGFPHPVVSLHTKNFQSKKFGKILWPDYTLRTWADYELNVIEKQLTEADLLGE